MAPLPASATRLAAVVADTEWDLGDIVDVVNLDQALTGRLLRAANSAMSGVQRTITTVDAAVMRLGPGMVLSLALGSGIQRRMNEAFPQYGLAENDLWRHSVAAATASDTAKRYCKVKIPAETFPIALLHDIGKLVLCRYLEPHVLEMLRRSQRQGRCSPLQAETEIMDVHHGELGGLIAQHWKLPEVFVRGITYHHNPEDAPADRDNTVCFAVQLADIVARNAGYGGKIGQLRIEDHPRLVEQLKLDPRGFEDLCAKVAETCEDILAAWG